MAMTYNSLAQMVQSYLQRQDETTINMIPTFIMLAENQIAVDVKSIIVENYVNGVFVPGVSGGAVLQKPGRWRRTISFNFGSGESFAERNILEPHSYEFLVNYWPNRNKMAAPLYYSDYGFSHWYVAPTPDQAYPFEISYLELPAPLSVNNQTNLITNYAPQLIFYGSMLQAQPFVRNPEMIPLWEKWYQQSVNYLNNQDLERIHDRSTKRDSD